MSHLQVFSVVFSTARVNRQIVCMYILPEWCNGDRSRALCCGQQCTDMLY